MLLKEIEWKIQREGYFVGTWDVVDEAIDIYIDTKEGINEFRELLSNADLECFPKIVNGSVANIEKSLVAVPIVFFKKSKPLDRQNSNIKYALLVGKIAATMAKVDGDIDEEEIQQIRKDIYKLSFLSESEKYRVFIRSIYALHQKSTKEEIMKSFSLLPAKAKSQALSIAKDIAIADHYINRSERFFLYEFYRLSNLPTNTVDRDLKEHARRKNVALEVYKKRDRIEESEFIMKIDNSFDQMLAEFEVI